MSDPTTRHMTHCAGDDPEMHTTTAKRDPLTAEQAAAYFKDSGTCPYCGSTDIEGSGHDYDGDQVWQRIDCNDCYRHWRDIFTLTAIDDDTEKGHKRPDHTPALLTALKEVAAICPAVTNDDYRILAEVHAYRKAAAHARAAIRAAEGE